MQDILFLSTGWDTSTAASSHLFAFVIFFVSGLLFPCPFWILQLHLCFWFFTTLIVVSRIVITIAVISRFDYSSSPRTGVHHSSTSV